MPPGALGLLIPLKLVSFFIYLESNAVILYKFWRPQPSLPCLGLQYSIRSKTRTTVSLSSMQVVFAEADMEKLPRDRPITANEGRAVGCLHQNIFTRKVTDIAFTSDFCNNHSHPRPVRPCIWRPASPSQTFPRPILDVPKSLVSRSKSQTVSDLLKVSDTHVPMSSPLLVPARPSFIHGHDFRHFLILALVQNYAFLLIWIEKPCYLQNQYLIIYQ